MFKNLFIYFLQINKFYTIKTCIRNIVKGRVIRKPTVSPLIPSTTYQLLVPHREQNATTWLS
jgi:hypothetical protein